MQPLPDLAAELVDSLHDLHGFHPGHRAVHAKGVCCRATFTASAEAAALTRARHMQGDAVAATVRFSNGSGSPSRHDGARDARGMATKFHLPGGDTTDIVALTLPVFFVRNPDDFLALTRAQRPDPDSGKPDVQLIEQFVAEHPETQLALGFSMFASPPASYARCRYFGIHAFRWLDSTGAGRFLRYRWEPEAGEASISEEESRSKERHYLRAELEERLASGTVGFTLLLQLAGPGDDPTDPTQMWPEEREIVVGGRLSVESFVEDQEAGCEALVFDPTRVIDGIQCSDDPILRVRPHAYSVSHDRRAASRSPSRKDLSSAEDRARGTQESDPPSP